MSPKHTSTAADLIAREIGRIIDLRSVRPIDDGHIAIRSQDGDTITGEIIAAADGTTVLAKFTLAVNVP